MRFRRHEPTAIHVWSAEEAAPELIGDVELYDLESGTSHEVTVDEKMLKAYREAHAQLTASLEHHCRTRGVSYVRADVAVPFDETILRVFRHAGVVA